jgi:apolipoprotein N-acyltransferase
MPGPFELVIMLTMTLLPYVIAKKLNTKLQQKNSSYKSFVWGYFIGIINIIWGGLFIFVFIGDLIMLIFTIIPIILGYFTIKRKKLWFIALTVISINPIVWVINWIYIKNRWNELV